MLMALPASSPSSGRIDTGTIAMSGASGSPSWLAR
jgi:hypothetical protein